MTIVLGKFCLFPPHKLLNVWLVSELDILELISFVQHKCSEMHTCILEMYSTCSRIHLYFRTSVLESRIYFGNTNTHSRTSILKMVIFIKKIQFREACILSLRWYRVVDGSSLAGVRLSMYELEERAMLEYYKIQRCTKQNVGCRKQCLSQGLATDSLFFLFSYLMLQEKKVS